MDNDLYDEVRLIRKALEEISITLVELLGVMTAPAVVKLEGRDE